jgi:hypothetical protein
MDDHLIRIFAAEIELQCRFILMAMHELNRAGVAGNDQELWMALQTIVVSAANLSKMLWGSFSPGRIRARAERRAPLRAALGVSDESPLYDMNLRNDFEHFDERLDTWKDAPRGGNIYIGRNIGSGNAIFVAGQPAEPHFHHFDPATARVSFWQHEVDINAIIQEVQSLLPRAAQLTGRFF